MREASSERQRRDPFLLDSLLWAYRLFLGREPEDLDVLSRHEAGLHTLEDVRRHFLGTPEFRSLDAVRRNIAIDPALLDAFPPSNGPGTDGFITDFIGTRTRCSYLPAAYSEASGIVEGPPGTERFGLHDPAEWEGTLRAVLDAGARFVAVELGAGWAPWLVASAAAARRRGIVDVHLAGVEGAQSHHAFMVQHFLDNGLDPDAHLLMHAVVGLDDGVAHFPKLPDPSADWGAQASFDDRNGDADDEVQSVAIETLLARLPPVDLLHCDVQGIEDQVLSAAMEVLTGRVRRVVAGTHGRSIEEHLMTAFGCAGWVLEREQPCHVLQGTDGRMLLARDGVQVWRNDRRDVDGIRETP